MTSKRFLVPLAVILMLATVVMPACAQGDDGEAAAADTAASSDTTSKASYAIGHNIGSNMHRQGIDFDVDQLVAGLRDGLAGNDPAVPPEEMQAAMQAFQQEVMAAQQAKMEQQGAENLAAGKAFLEENAKKEGVQVSDSGLQYQILEPGSGPSPESGDTVVVHYTGTLIDGTKFDSSRDRGQPATFPVDGVIPGFSEGLKLLKKGGKAKLWIPADIGYGPQGAGAAIPPNATLIFDIEMVDVQKAGGDGGSMDSGSMDDDSMSDDSMSDDSMDDGR
jgi:FKBP-type peptidyl-prolyl cis-trans isomerase